MDDYQAWASIPKKKNDGTKLVSSISKGIRASQCPGIKTFTGQEVKIKLSTVNWTQKAGMRLGI